MSKEVETITRRRMVSRHDIAEYEAEGWKFEKNFGTQSAFVTRTEKVKVAVVPSKPQEEKAEKKEGKEKSKA